MDVHLIAVGKLRPYYRAACDDYLRRLSRYGAVTEREIREAGRATRPSGAARNRRIESALPERSTLIVLDRDGPNGPRELARRLDRRAARGAAARWSAGLWFSRQSYPRAATRGDGPLTLPHELAG